MCVCLWVCVLLHATCCRERSTCVNAVYSPRCERSGHSSSLFPASSVCLGKKRATTQYQQNIQHRGDCHHSVPTKHPTQRWLPPLSTNKTSNTEVTATTQYQQNIQHRGDCHHSLPTKHPTQRWLPPTTQYQQNIQHKGDCQPSPVSTKLYFLNTIPVVAENSLKTRHMQEKYSTVHFITPHPFLHMHMHGHTHTHLPTSTCMDTHTHTLTHIHMHGHTHTHTYPHPHAWTHTLTHTHMHGHTHLPTPTCMDTHTHTHSHTHMHWHRHTPTHTCTDTHTHTQNIPYSVLRVLKGISGNVIIPANDKTVHLWPVYQPGQQRMTKPFSCNHPTSHDAYICWMWQHCAAVANLLS